MAHEAQLKMLRYQLNPHFLFNTLNAISTLVLDHKNGTANGMVGSLSAFLRYSLDSDPVQRVTLAQEIEATNQYLGIEQLRFGERLRVRMNIEPRRTRRAGAEPDPAAADRERDQVCGVQTRGRRRDRDRGDAQRRRSRSS